jgi:hypothetical protein
VGPNVIHTTHPVICATTVSCVNSAEKGRNATQGKRIEIWTKIFCALQFPESRMISQYRSDSNKI